MNRLNWEFFSSDKPNPEQEPPSGMPEKEAEADDDDVVEESETQEEEALEPVHIPQSTNRT